QQARREAAAMGHGGMTLSDSLPEAEQNVMSGDRTGRRFVDHLLQLVVDDVVGDRLQIGNDEAEEAIVFEDAAEFGQRLRHLMQIEMLDAMGGPDRIGESTRN